MNGPAPTLTTSPNALSPLLPCLFRPFTEPLKGPTETRKEVRHWVGEINGEPTALLRCCASGRSTRKLARCGMTGRT